MTNQHATNINAAPTKTFFVDMLTRDIPLEQAILDLVDNSVDGAKSLQKTGERPFDGFEIKIELSKDKFSIIDNCGGFDSASAAQYAFRFGRPQNFPRASHSIGQFGVGMKRALFKFGTEFKVRSATKDDAWEILVNVPEWESIEDDWTFPWGEFQPDENISNLKPGTEIIVPTLRPEVAWKFSTANFKNSIIALIKSKHRQFIAAGLTIKVNEHHLDATSLYLLMSQDTSFRPGVDEMTFTEKGLADVHVRIIVGVGPSAPRDAGWYVVCNGRVVLEADRRTTTGWGLVEEASNRVEIPSYHNQFARFRGVVTFDSDDSSRVPWNTTKTDVDQDGKVWQQTFQRMKEMMRPVISFLNDLDHDIDEHTRDNSPLLQFVAAAAAVKHDAVPLQKTSFTAPTRGTLAKVVRTIKIQFSRPREQVDFLMKELNVASAKAVGEATFDLIYSRLEDE
ncbi:MAG: hypothetical protein C0460_15930 [Methylibium sp.]|jgi:hypothetical protein|nr:hypothetical protein [Methylibium sp.]|mmetsp:Transcript_41601/g.97626  ORF Transcript_41601/g.97626 Transcript_41601/m.97626 type:complete len:452 (-) Transcript_41601:4263-5618(-)